MLTADGDLVDLGDRCLCPFIGFGAGRSTPSVCRTVVFFATQVTVKDGPSRRSAGR
jgi:hypothetical protein